MSPPDDDPLPEPLPGVMLPVPEPEPDDEPEPDVEPEPLEPFELLEPFESFEPLVPPATFVEAPLALAM